MKTSPMMFFRGTEPHARESHDSLRLSPMKKYPPRGTCHVSCRPPPRPGLMYGSLMTRPLTESTFCLYVTVSPGSPIRRFTNVPLALHAACAAAVGVLKTM